MRFSRTSLRRGSTALFLALIAGASCAPTIDLPPVAAFPPKPLPDYAIRNALVDATVEVHALGIEPDDSGIAYGEGIATGVIIGREGPFVLTAFHAVRHARYVGVRLLYYDVDEVRASDDIPMRIVRSSEEMDVALLEPIDRHLSTGAAPAAHGLPAPGEPVRYYGATSAEVAGTVAAGPVTLPRPGLIAVSAPSRYGDSGAPLVNGKGELLGIMVMGSDRRKLSFFVPIRPALAALDVRSQD